MSEYQPLTPYPSTRIDRFWSHVARGDACWEWQASRTPGGYGQFWDGTRLVQAHRFAYMASVGSIPDGLHVCHHCDNRPCVRPEHLFLGSRFDNMRDAATKGRLRSPHLRPDMGAAMQRAKTHCPQGHPYDEINTYRPPGSPNRRHCRACQRGRGK